MSEQSPNKMDRKAFLRSIIFGMGIVVTGGSFLFFSRRENGTLYPVNKSMSGEELAGWTDEIENSIQLIGKKYIESYPQGSKEELINEVNAILLRGLNQDELYDLTGRLKKLVRTDFEESNFVEVDNWILAKTEAQICALYYM